MSDENAPLGTTETGDFPPSGTDVHRTSAPPRDNLVRASAGGFELDSAGDGMPIIHGHAAVFNQWAKIDSLVEGRFLERITPGAFRKTITENKPNMRMLFNHGQDPQIGDKPLAPIETLEEDATGLAYSGRMLDTTYNRELIPGLQAGLYGSSFRFRVVKEDMNHKAKASDYNPDALPERTIQEASVMEFGPVTFPAYAGAAAGLRSLTDRFVLNRLASDPERLEELVEDIATPDTAEPEKSTPTAEPAPATPERVASKPTSARKEKTMAELLPDERASRMSELEAEIKEVNAKFTGKLPLDVKVSYEANKKELADLAEDEREYQDRKVDLARLGQVKERTDWKPPEISVVVKPDNIYDLEEVDKRGRNSTERGQMLRDNAMRAAETTSWANPNTDVPKSQDKIARLLDHADTEDKEFARRILATGSPVYKRAFEKLLKSHGNTAVLTPEEQRGTALTMGGTGQYLVPFAFDPTVIAIGAHTTINPYRRTCRNIDVVGATIWHGLTSTAAVAVRGVENLVAAEQGPTFAQPAFTPSTVKLQITMSEETSQDRPDIASELAVLIQEAKDNEEENSFAVGTNATTTLGCIGMGAAYATSGAFTQMDTIGSTTLAIADLYAVEVALPIRHRALAQWYMSRGTIRKIQAFETTYGILFNAAQTMGAAYPAVGNPEQDAFGNTGLKLLGYPVNESPSFPTATTSHVIVATLANPTQFVVVDRVGMTIQFIPWIQTAGTIYVAGQTAIYASWRNACGPLNVDAGRELDYKT